jgi:hypothetical protein
MNAIAAEVAVPTAPAGKASGKKERDAEKVTMTDGREVEFVGKARFYKDVMARLPSGEWQVLDDLTNEQLAGITINDLAIRMDFRNGATRTYPLNPALALRFTGHGGKQKYGDELAGEDAPDLDDWAETTDRLHERLMGGEWAKARVGGGMAGTSVLLQALMEFTGRTAQEVRDHIRDWSPQQKQQLRMDPEIKPLVDAIEAAKAAKATHVDTAALKASLKGLAA